MKNPLKNKPFKRIALVLSLAALVIWGLLGTGASLAWFTDTTPDLTNIFHFADFDVGVYYEETDGNWTEITDKTKVFDEEALFEPGYVQVVYLKVVNRGDRPFEFFTAVNVNRSSPAENAFGQEFLLQDYLKFGITISSTPEEMRESIPDRDAAVEIATMPLHSYATDTAVLESGEATYIALIVRMPTDVGNIANYRGSRIPEVELGITVKADQIQN